MLLEKEKSLSKQKYVASVFNKHFGLTTERKKEKIQN